MSETTLSVSFSLTLKETALSEQEGVYFFKKTSTLRHFTR